MRPLLKLAYERECLTRNPQSWIHKRWEVPEEIDPFSFAEVQAFLAALPDPKWVRFYTVAFGTSLRPSEQYALQWEHVDFAQKLLYIRQGFVQDRMTSLKTAGSRRDVEMLPHVEEALRRHGEGAHGALSSRMTLAARCTGTRYVTVSGILRWRGQDSAIEHRTKPSIPSRP